MTQKLLSTSQFIFTAFLCLTLLGNSGFAKPQVANPGTIFAEINGKVVVEAEHYFDQSKNDERSFHLTHSKMTPSISPDGDPSHVAGASGGAYLEILPDTRRTHDDKLIRGENFSPEPGKLAVLSYKVHFSNPGKYYVWVRAYSTGSEDNGLHVGIDGTWPASGQRLQWCQGKKTWRWESKQRTESEHCGEPYKIFLQVDKAGEHVIHFSMREDGFEFDKWIMTKEREFKRPDGVGPNSAVYSGEMPKSFPFVKPEPKPELEGQPTKAPQLDKSTSPTKPVSNLPLQMPRAADGDGSLEITGEFKQWHKITFDLQGPFAHEQDNAPNPFTDLSFSVQLKHEDGTQYVIPGYFAADGNAANTSASAGNVWRANFAPDRIGKWTYSVNFSMGENVALDASRPSEVVGKYSASEGTIDVAPSDKAGRDLRGQGRLRYVGKRYLQFAGSKKYFLKAGADAPETLLAYAEFDNTIAGNPKKAPLKSWQPHVRDWQPGDPSWADGRGKGLIGAVNYLSGKGCNAFSFLTYNAGGDGDNVWPFIDRGDKMHYDCSKLDQWGILFDHATIQGMYLHFKMQETENDDHIRGKAGGFVPESLDGGNLGWQRRLYCRELIARFGHNLALNWNLGEENTQSNKQQKSMIDYIAKLDAYDHNIVVHTFPDQQDKVYSKLLGDQSGLTGTSLQNSSLETTHAQTLKWIQKSEAAGRPWVVAFDESGSAAHAQCPDLGYKGFDGKDKTGAMIYTQHKVRKQTLWGTLMAGGAGNEYYFGYKFAENDIVCQDWRSRDKSWDYCRFALEFFDSEGVPFWEMSNADELVGNAEHEAGKFCFAKAGEIYLVYLPDGGEAEIDLRNQKGQFNVEWFNPRTGGMLQTGSVLSIKSGGSVSLGQPPKEASEDWLAVVRRKR
ncbi:MAG: DUF5060 domain-containing protein [Planctomycetota bacterium]